MFGLEDEILIAKDLSAKIHSYAITGNIIIVNEETAFSFTQEGQAFAIAHELSHYSHGHLNKRTYLNLVWIVIDLSFLSLAHYRSRLYLVAFVLAEIGIFHLDQAVSRMHEKEADLTAIENLGANHGAKEFFFLNLAFDALHFLEANKIQFPRQPNIEKSISTLFKIGIALESVTPVKLALSHPTHVERLQYCCIEE
jgi:Zn-dependent protease with chaperone function